MKFAGNLVSLLVVSLQIVNIPAYRIKRFKDYSDAINNVPITNQVAKKKEEDERYKRNCKVVPFDVQCHGRCPHTDNEWNSVRESWNCSMFRKGATYHCIYDMHGNPVEACGIPIYCNKGEGPIISFPEGDSKLANITCHWCPEKYFNPRESVKSDNVSRCPERTKCNDLGLIECDIVTGEKRYWTDSKCECDVKNLYFPYMMENDCRNFPILSCFRNPPCQKSKEGFDQIYKYSAEGYICTPGCNDSFEFRTPQSKDCEPIIVDGNGNKTNDNVTRKYESTHSPTLPEVNTSKTSIPTNEGNDASKSNDNNKWIIVGVILTVVGLFIISYCAIGCFKCFKYRKGRSGNRTRQDQAEVLDPMIDSTNNNQNKDTKLKALKIIFCWPCNNDGDQNGATGLQGPPRTGDIELQGPMNGNANNDQNEDAELLGNLPSSPENMDNVGDCSQVNLTSSPENADNEGDRSQVNLPSSSENMDSVGDSSQVNLISSPEYADNEEDSSQVNLPSSPENTDSVGDSSQVNLTSSPENADNEVDSSQVNLPSSPGNTDGVGDSSQVNSTSSPENADNEGDSSQGRQRWIDELPEEIKESNLTEFPNVACYIGKGWEEIAIKVEIMNSEIDHIKADYKDNELARIKEVIRLYIQRHESPTVFNFLQILKECWRSTFVEWNRLKKYLYETWNQKTTLRE